MPNPLVSLNTLNDLPADGSWRICEQVILVEGLHKVGAKKKTEVFNFTIGDEDGTMMIVEAWEEKGILCQAIIKEGNKIVIGKAELWADTYRHKHRVANSAYRIRLNYGSEISRESPGNKLEERLSTTSYLTKMPTWREIKYPDYLSNERYYVLAFITDANKDNTLYKTCRRPICPRRTVFCWGKSPLCNHCEQQSDDFMWNFRVVLTLRYDGSEVKVTIFGERAEKLFGLTGEEGSKMRKDDPSQFEQVFKAVVDRRLVFRLRPHFYNGQIQYTVCDYFESQA